MFSLLLHVNSMSRVVSRISRRHSFGIPYVRGLRIKTLSSTTPYTLQLQIKRRKHVVAKLDATWAVKNVDFASRLRVLTSVDGVLDFVDKQNALEPVDIGVTFRRLVEFTLDQSHLEKTISINLANDGRMTRIVQQLDTQVVDTDILLSVLASLLQLPSMDLGIVKSVEAKVGHLLANMRISQVVRVIKITVEANIDNASRDKKHSTGTSNAANEISKTGFENNLNIKSEDRTLRVNALATLERRWVEINSPQDMVTLMYVVPQNGYDRLWARLDERLLERCEAMSTKELYRVLYVMARRQRRSAPVIRSLVYHFNKRSRAGEATQHTNLSVVTEISHPEISTETLSLHSTTSLEIPSPVEYTVPPAPLTLVQLSNLTYACVTLNIRDNKFVNTLVNAIKLYFNDSAATADVIPVYSSILQSLAALQWLDTKAMDRICSLFLTYADKVTINQWSNLILSSASLGYCPASMTKEYFASLVKRLKEGGNQRAWLDVVWSAAVLDMITAEMTASVLNGDFVNSLEPKTCSSHPIPARLKLLNINGIAKHTIIGDHDHQILDEEYISNVFSGLTVRRHGVLKKTLLDTIGKMASTDKYLLVDVRTPAGYNIDVEMFTNDNGQLQPVADYCNKFPPPLVLPVGIHRIAIKLLDTSDLTRGSVQPTGLNSLCSRYLTAVGYKIIQISHEDLKDSTTIVKRVHYLHSRLIDTLRGTITESSVAQDVVNDSETPGFKSSSSAPLNTFNKEGTILKSISSVERQELNRPTTVVDSVSETVYEQKQETQRIDVDSFVNINNLREAQEPRRSGEVLMSEARTNKKKQHQSTKKKGSKSISEASQTGRSVDIRELFEEIPTIVTSEKSDNNDENRRPKKSTVVPDISLGDTDNRIK